MIVNTTARHCELDPEVRIFAQQRLERLARYVRNPRDLMEAHVVVAAEKYRHSAEITLKLRHGEVVGREQANDPRAAIDLAAERLEHQIRRLKDKRLGKKRAARNRDAERTAGAPTEEELERNLGEGPAPGPDGDGAGAPRED